MERARERSDTASGGLGHACPAILMAVYTDPEHVPPLLNSACALAESGYRVKVLGVNMGTEFGYQAPPGVEMVRFRPWGFRWAEGTLRNVASYAEFFARLAAEVFTRRYALVIGHYLVGFSCVTLLAWLGRLPFGYHNHDLVEVGVLGSLGRLLRRLEVWGARRANFLVLPNRDRARIFRQETGTTQPIFVVFNCPPLSSQAEPGDFLRRWLVEQGVEARKIVLRQGFLVPANCLEELIEALPYWTLGTHLVLCGNPQSPSYLTELRQRIRERGVGDRVHFLERADYRTWRECTRSADLAVALYRDTNVNNRYMAGAGNKLFLPMSAGVPVVAPDLPGFAEIVEGSGCGLCVSSTDPAAIAAAVNRILDDPDLQARCSAAARKAFLEKYNYEVQFRPVLELIRGMAG